ncbi:hypothetical protein J6590_107758, partial [Homalodisca vitripennis]
MCKSDVESWICIDCKTVKVSENSLAKDNSYLLMNNNHLTSELEEVKSKLQEQKTLDEADLETSLTLAAEAGNALLHENNKLRQDIQSKHECNSKLEITLASMEAKMEDLLAAEEKYVEQIETLQEKLHDTLLELEKSKQNQSELQNLFEDHDYTQNQLLTQYSQKITNLEKSILKMNNEENCSHESANKLQNPKSYKSTETQTYSETLTTISNSSFLLELAKLRQRQDEADLKIRDIAAQLDNNSKQRDKEKTASSLDYCKQNKEKPKSQGQTNTSLRKSRAFNGKGNVFSISLQVAKSRPSTTTLQETGLIGGTNPPPTKKLPTTLTEVSSQLTTLQASEPSFSTTLQATGLTEGTSQTPTKKLSTPTLTEVSSQLTTLLETGLTGGTSQTPTKKLSTTTLTEVSSQLTTLLETGLTGGTSQTPTKKLSRTTLTEVSSQLTTLQATEPSLLTTLQATGLTEGTSQTPTKKLSTPTLTEVSSQLTTLLETGLTGGTSQTPTKKLSTPTLTE